MFMNVNLRSNHFNFGKFSNIKDGSFLILNPDMSRNSTFSPNFSKYFDVSSSILGSFKNLKKDKLSKLGSFKSNISDPILITM